MDSRKTVWTQTAAVLLGQAVGLGVLYGVFALLHKFETAVVLGGIVGALVATVNFFFMAVSATLAADKAEKQDVAGGKKLMNLSYTLRLLCLFGIFFVCIKSGYFNIFALLIPLLFVRPSLMLLAFFRKPGEEKV